MTKVADPRQANRLLRLLPEGEFEALSRDFERVSFGSGETVYEVDVPLTKVYFPIRAVLSNIIMMEDGNGVETNTIGREGMIGAHAALGSYTVGAKLMCQISGDAVSMELSRFQSQLDALPVFRDLIGRYNVTLLQVVSQTAACNRLHHVNQRLARWLLMTHDRVFNGSFALTHEFLGLMLGVNRPAVSVAAGALQHAGLIEYSRGDIKVKDRAGLEEASCECYHIVTHLFELLLPNGVVAPSVARWVP